MAYQPWEGDGYRVSHFNFAPEVRASYRFREPYVVVDATFLKMDHLEGGRLYSPEEYREVASLLEEAGVRETVFLTDAYHMTPKGDSILEGLYAVAKAGTKLKLRVSGFFSTWRPGRYKDRIRMLAEHGAHELELLVHPPRVLRGHRVDATEEDAKREAEERLQELPEAIQYAKSQGLGVTVGYTYAVMEDIQEMTDLLNRFIRHGAERLYLADSKGCATVDATRYYLSRIRRGLVQDVPIIYHVHDDFGLGTALALAAACEGAWPQLSVNGAADRGFASLEEVVLCLELLYGVRTGVDLTVLPKLCYTLERITGITNPPYKAVSGRHITLPPYSFGLIGMLQGRGWLELDLSQFEPRLVGRRPQWGIWYATLHRRTVEAKLQQMGLPSDEETVERVRQALKERLDAQGNKLPVILYEAEVERVCREVVGG